MTYKEAFATVLKQLREEHNLTKTKLAQLAGLDRTSIGKMENAERSPTIETVAMLGKAFKIPGSKILERAEKLY